MREKEAGNHRGQSNESSKSYKLFCTLSMTNLSFTLPALVRKNGKAKASTSIRITGKFSL